jgi:hypothetical protein
MSDKKITELPFLEALSPDDKIVVVANRDGKLQDFNTSIAVLAKAIASILEEKN